jgi:hypothetical protein
MNKIGAYDKDSSEKLTPVIEKSLNNNIKEYLYRNGETENAQSEIRKELENTLRYIVDVNIGFEMFGETRAEKGGIIRGKETSADEVKDERGAFMDVVNLGGYPLACTPIIDPVNGCPISRLKIGDIVHVAIPETNDISKKVMDYVRLEKEGVPAFPVSLIQALESGNCVVILKINDEINGVLTLSSDMMLKTDALPQAATEEHLLFKKLFNPENLILGGLLLLILLLLYLITYFIHF